MREKKDINIEIGGNIQVAREQAGYTQDTLSEMLGMTPNHLSAIERGASGISLEALQRLCRLLGVSADRIIFGTDAPEAEALRLPDVFRILSRNTGNRFKSCCPLF